jgi:phosphate transport system substrate-binding protein
MTQRRNREAVPRLHPIHPLVCILLLCSVATGNHQARSAAASSQVKNIFVGSFGNTTGADSIRQRIVDQLRGSRVLHVVDRPGEAGASITGTVGLWVTGYISVGNPPSHVNRQPVYDGYLSVDVVDNSGTPIWSYLATPSKFRLKPISKDLADQVVKKLSEVLRKGFGEGVSGASAAAAVAGEAPVSVHGAGATFPWPIYEKWFQSFQQRDPNVHIKYDPVGSETGTRLLVENRVDFAASDMPLSDQSMARSGVRFLHFASVLGAVVPIYNLPTSGRRLNFTGGILAGIYAGQIKRWDDPAIRAANRGLALPTKDIVVVHRSDGSGTTYAFTDYLCKISPKWKESIASGTTVSWPVGNGAERNEGVAAFVGQTPNSIGYVELIYAIQHELSFGAVQNSAGNFVKADLASVTAAASGIGDRDDPDFRVSITNAAGKQAYPISTFTWLLVPEQISDTRKRAVLIEFLRWMLTSGQKQCAGMGYPPLPVGVASRQLQILKTVK